MTNLCNENFLLNLGHIREDNKKDNMQIKGFTFDNITKNAIVTITLRILVGRKNVDASFHVVRNSRYNALLGRPWSYKMKVILSTIHQYLKFPFKGKVITIKAKKPLSQNKKRQITNRTNS